jgi:hypothetical protein
MVLPCLAEYFGQHDHVRAHSMSGSLTSTMTTWWRSRLVRVPDISSHLVPNHTEASGSENRVDECYLLLYALGLRTIVITDLAFSFSYYLLCGAGRDYKTPPPGRIRDKCRCLRIWAGQHLLMDVLLHPSWSNVPYIFVCACDFQLLAKAALHWLPNFGDSPECVYSPICQKVSTHKP